MTFSKFCTATQYVQKTVLLFHGVFLLERRVNDLLAVLYQVDNFYVEVFFRDNSTGIYQLKSYADVNGIDAYLCLIDISDLTELLL
jgi:hypothetical protein